MAADPAVVRGGPSDPMEQRMRAVEGAIIRIDAILPTLATKIDLAELKAELHESLHGMQKTINEQTWKMFGAMFIVAGLLLAGIKLIP